MQKSADDIRELKGGIGSAIHERLYRIGKAKGIAVSREAALEVGEKRGRVRYVRG